MCEEIERRWRDGGCVSTCAKTGCRGEGLSLVSFDRRLVFASWHSLCTGKNGRCLESAVRWSVVISAWGMSWR
jgi:hypothetical protein